MPRADAHTFRDFVLNYAERLARPLGLGWLVDFLATPGRLTEIARYVGASAVALVFDTCVFLALVAWTSLATPVAGAIGYLSGMLLNYGLSIRYIFSTAATGKTSQRLILEYIATGVLGVCITYALIALVADILGAPPLFAKAVAVAVTFTVIYLVRAIGVFRPRLHPSNQAPVMSATLPAAE